VGERLVQAARAAALPRAVNDADVYCREEAARIVAHLRRYGNAHTVAVFVTPEGIFFARVDGRRIYHTLIAKWGHCMIGYYTRRVDPIDLRMDIFHAASEIGLL
jgi:hypothetical protein